MSLAEIAAIAVALAMDAFAVALAAGVILQPLTWRAGFRLSFHFGLFQGLMPIVGWLSGLAARSFVRTWSHWIAFGLLLYVGGRMLYEALDGEGERLRSDPSRGVSLVVLSVATSIDALAVGISLAMLSVDVWLPALIIGLVAACFTIVGLLLGARVGSSWGKRVEVLGGLILIAIGCRILFTALLSG